MAGGESLIQTTGHDSTKLGVYKTRFVAVRTYEKLDVTLTKHDLIEMKEVNSLNISITDSLLDFRVNPFTAGTVFRHQNLASIDVRF